MLLNSRHALGLRTRIYTTRVRDSAGNSLAENAVQRARGFGMHDAGRFDEPHWSKPELQPWAPIGMLVGR